MIDVEYLKSVFYYEDGSLFYISSKEKAGQLNPQGYIDIRIARQVYKAHRLIFAYFYGSFDPELEIDHINGNRSDNTIENLRLATRQQNVFNSKLSKANTSGFKGVSLHKKTGLWRAQIRFNNKKMLLGMFEHPEEASAAYEAKAAELFGEYCRDLDHQRLEYEVLKIAERIKR